MTEFRKLDAASTKIFEDGLRKVSHEFKINAEDAQRSLKVLSRFEILKGYESLFVHRSAQFTNGQKSFVITLIEKYMTIMQPISRRSHHRHAVDVHEVEPVLMMEVPSALGQVLMRPETLGDKIADIFNRIDIDFAQYPGFSSNYFVEGTKPEMVKTLMPSYLLAALERTSGLIVEIHDGHCLMRHEKTLSEETLLSLIDVGRDLVR